MTLFYSCFKFLLAVAGLSLLVAQDVPNAFRQLVNANDLGNSTLECLQNSVDMHEGNVELGEAWDAIEEEYSTRYCTRIYCWWFFSCKWYIGQTCIYDYGGFASTPDYIMECLEDPEGQLFDMYQYFSCNVQVNGVPELNEFALLHRPICGHASCSSEEGGQLWEQSSNEFLPVYENHVRAFYGDTKCKYDVECLQSISCSGDLVIRNETGSVVYTAELTGMPG